MIKIYRSFFVIECLYKVGEVYYETDNNTKKILRQCGHRHRTPEKGEWISSEEVAQQIGRSKAVVNDEFRKLRAMGLLEVIEAFREWSKAKLTDIGLIALDEIGPISDSK